MHDRQQHQKEVVGFLQKHFSSTDWTLSLPKGSGNETYFARGDSRTYFIKLGANAENYHALASIGLTPPVLASGSLEDSTSIIVQPYIIGKKPSQVDFCDYLEEIARMINTVHHSPDVKRVLPGVSSELYNTVGLDSLRRLQQKWGHYKSQVSSVTKFVDEGLASLQHQVDGFAGAGLVASHNDICNANWLISLDGRIYLIDLDSLSLEDPAVDIGAILWWYYPPPLRPRFLEVVGYANDEHFHSRMRVRMAMHCLNIILPRERSFDRFAPNTFAEELIDFRAVLAGEENPQGYRSKTRRRHIDNR
jgi:thiamine kinase-like enzyme